MDQPSDNLPSPHDAPDKAERVLRMFDRIARRYTLVNTIISLGQDGRWRREAVRLARIRPGDRLLDVCCGPGELADAFAAARPAPAEIVACDFSPQMLRQAERRQRLRTLPLRLVQADAMDLPFPDGRFDLVSCAFGVRNLSDARAGLGEFARVLAPGGRLVVVEFAMPPGRLLRAGYRLYFTRLLPRIGGLISGQRSAYAYLPRSVETFFSPDRIADMFRGVGLGDVRQRRMTLGAAVATVGTRR